MFIDSITLPDLPGLSLTAGNTEFPVTGVDITGNVDGDGIVWNITAVFKNPLDSPVEASFTLPLPNGGAVVGMSMKIGDRIIEADIKEREAARVEYEQAKEQGFTTALFEQDRAEIFTISVGNIHPSEGISVEIEIHDRVAIDGSEARLRMPTMIKPRYIPEGVPDAEAINPPRISGQAPRVATVSVNFAQDATDVICETIPQAVVTPRKVTITDFDLTCDIILHWTIPVAIAHAKWVPDADNQEMGTLEVNIRVPEKKSSPRRRKAVQIMFDRSGSMRSHYLEWARRISMDVIGSLTDEDLIHVLTFDSVIEVLGPTEHGFVRATRPVKKALQEELLKITARGGTSLTEAIKAGGAAIALLDDLENSENIDRIALLISDGAYGDEASAVYHRENDLGGSRVISVAIGENANGFLEALSATGVCVYVSSEAGLSEASNKVMSRVATAAYSQAQLLATGLTHQAPRHAPDLYPDVLVTLSGRMPRPEEGASVEVVSLDEHVVTLPIAISQDSSTTTRWASQYIKSLDYGMMSTNFSAMGIKRHDSLEAQIVAMSIKYRVLSKYTAWLAVDRSRTTDQVITQKLVQPQIDYIDDLRLTSVLRHSSVSPMSVGLKLSGSMARPASSFHDHFLNPDVSEAMSKLRSIASMKQLPRSEFPNAVLALIAEIDQYLSASPVDDRDQMLSNVRTASLVLLSTFSKRIIGKRLSAELETALQSVMLDVNSHTDQTNLILSNLRDTLSGHSSLKKTRTQRRR
jgi:Ca-activated chloride channel family protein